MLCVGPEANSIPAAPCCAQVARQEQIDAVRAELSNKAGGDADATYEAEKQRAGDEKRAELEAQLAAAKEAYEAQAAEAQVRWGLGFMVR